MDTLSKNRALQLAYGDFFAQWQWDWFTTLTFNDSVHPEKAEKLFRVWISRLNKDLYGRRWFNREPHGTHWLLTIEFHKSGSIHLHALVGNTKDARRLSWMDNWHELDYKSGFARVEPITYKGAATRYVTKYTTKGGELFFSGNLRSQINKASVQ